MFPKAIDSLIYSDSYGEYCFNLDIPERRKCMLALYNQGEYTPPEDAAPSIVNLVNRYSDIADCWDKRIDENNVIPFIYWIMEKVVFSKVWTNSDEFAYPYSTPISWLRISMPPASPPWRWTAILAMRSAAPPGIS